MKYVAALALVLPALGLAPGLVAAQPYSRYIAGIAPSRWDWFWPT